MRILGQLDPARPVRTGVDIAIGSDEPMPAAGQEVKLAGLGWCRIVAMRPLDDPVGGLRPGERGYRVEIVGPGRKVSEDEPDGDEIRAQMRALLPAEEQAGFDNDASSFAHDDGTIEVCGAFIALGWTFDRLVAARDEASIKLVLDFADAMLRGFPPSPGTDAPDGSVYNSVLACFLEDILPVPANEQPFILPHLGPLARAHYERDEPWALQPSGPS